MSARSACQLVLQVQGVAREQFEVLDPVVVALPVLVVDDLDRIEQTSDVRFHHQPMFKNIAVPLCARMIASFHQNVALLVALCAAPPASAIWSGASALRDVFRRLLLAPQMMTRQVAPLSSQRDHRGIEVAMRDDATASASARRLLQWSFRHSYTIA